MELIELLVDIWITITAPIDALFGKNKYIKEILASAIAMDNSQEEHFCRDFGSVVAQHRKQADIIVLIPCIDKKGRRVFSIYAVNSKSKLVWKKEGIRLEKNDGWGNTILCYHNYKGRNGV